MTPPGRYKDDSLVTSSGSVYYPLPPYRIRGEVTSAEPVTPAFAYNRFLIVPGYAPFYRWDFDDWGGPFDFDWDYYPTYYRVWGVHLPTRDMIRHAIPEGVLENGGRLSGFLYFPKVDRRHQEEGLKFSIDLVDASTQEHIGQITIPFEIRPSTER